MATRYAERASHQITKTFRCLTVKVSSVVEALGNVEARDKLCHGVRRNLSLLVFSSQLGLPTSISYRKGFSQLNVSKEVPIYLVMTSGGIYLSFKLAQRADPYLYKAEFESSSYEASKEVKGRRRNIDWIRRNRRISVRGEVGLSFQIHETQLHRALPAGEISIWM